MDWSIVDLPVTTVLKKTVSPYPINGSSAGGGGSQVPLSSVLLCADWLSLVQVVGKQPRLP